MPPPPPPPPATADPFCGFTSPCFCRWRSCCSPRIPIVAAGRDYECMPLGADDRPASSLVVGFLSTFAGTNLLRLHRFRVARSGRILGDSGDVLEILGDVECDEGKNAWLQSWRVTASSSPGGGGGHSICLFSRVIRLRNGVLPPRPLLLSPEIAGGGSIPLTPLPGFLPDQCPNRPILAAGELWAPYLKRKDEDVYCLVMLRLNHDADRWVEAGPEMPCHGSVVQGYAVLGCTILLYLQPCPLFFTFDCSNCAWAAVVTEAGARYAPITGRAVYVEEDDTIYFICGIFVNAYKLCKDHDKQCYRMAPPIMVDSVCPFFRSREGEGILTHLGDRVMCSVWISNCDTRHALITTFRVKGSHGSHYDSCFEPKGLKIMHSTCRRLDMRPSRHEVSLYEICFLQEIHDGTELPLTKKKRQTAMAPSMLVQDMEVATSSSVGGSSVIRACCRKFMIRLPRSTAVMLDDSAIQTNNTLYFICQFDSGSALYKINILDGKLTCHDQTLTPHCNIDTFICDADYDLMDQPCPRYSVCSGNNICTIHCKQHEISLCNFCSGTLHRTDTRKPANFGPLALVLVVGQDLIAVTATLSVYYLSPDTASWKHHVTHGPVDLKGEIKLSGYVVLSEHSFMVSDANSSSCFLLDLQNDKWCAVIPGNWFRYGVLTRRSIYVDGFIYTCTYRGLAAYELTEHGYSYCFGDQIDLEFTWGNFWKYDRMCFDYLGKHTISGAIMFCVVQGEDNTQSSFQVKHPVCITTVQVKTERTLQGKLKPVTLSHVDVGTSYVEQNRERIWTSGCFAQL
ncbi:hypothetical protein ACP4OV_015873 [Aristida adscensionis]